MKKRAFNLLLFITTVAFSQSENIDSFKLGQVTIEELRMNSYEKDTTAIALVLSEQGNTYHYEKSKKANFKALATDYYCRIKILKKEGLEKGMIKIPFEKEQRVFDIRAVTYNLSNGKALNKSVLSEKDILREDRDGKFQTTLKFPDLKVGSVIEYRFSLLTTNFSNLKDWHFQSDIPKIESKYKLSILTNLEYNVRLSGLLKLNKEHQVLKKKCVNIKGYENAPCVKMNYEMRDVPAFKEEQYMLSRKNYISRLVFNLISQKFYEYQSKENSNSYNNLELKKEKVGVGKNYSITWRELDKVFKKKVFNNQLAKKNFLKKKLPSEIIESKDKYQQATLTYKFIQDHYDWNLTYLSNKQLNLKESYKKKTGSVDAINLSLYQSLKALGIESYLVVLSTRENGFPTEFFPVIKDFNYVIVKTVINGKSYFLDATDKYLSFGQVRFECLNDKVRVLDFEKGGYWDTIELKEPSSIASKVKMTLNEKNILRGNITIISKGYKASDKRKQLTTKSKEDYLKKNIVANSQVKIIEYKVEDEGNLEKPLKESLSIEVPSDLNKEEVLRINPFFEKRIKENPFQLKKRKYPVDFGTTSKYSYLINLKIPKGYIINRIPKSSSFSLPGNSGLFDLKVQKKENEINIFMRYSINKKRFFVVEYQKLKEFFRQIIKAQNSFVEISTN